MRQLTLGFAAALMVSTAALAQANLPAPPPPDAVAAQAAAVPETVYAKTDANIRAGAGTEYTVIGKVAAGQPIQVTGVAPGSPDWLQVVSGGFVAMAVTSPTPVAVAQHVHHHHTSTQPVADNFPVGSCQPYSRVIDIAGQPPQQVNGTACKGPDGAWKIQGNGPAAGIPLPPPRPIVVQQAPVYAPPPVYAQPVPVYPQPGYPVYR